MVSISHNGIGFFSCIKIAGVSILPPLITEERRKELNEDKAKAIAIEKKLVRKRSSIDSGVMTGSYIDNFKNNELQQINNSTTYQFSTSDLTSSDYENYQQHVNSQSSQADSGCNESFLKSALEDSEFRELFYSTAERLFNSHDGKSQSSHGDSVSSENLLMSALEDSEFREFFYSTAEKIFKDNHATDIINLPDNKCCSFETKSALCEPGNEVYDSEIVEIPSDMSTFETLKSNESLDFGVYKDKHEQFPCYVGNEHVVKSSESIDNENLRNIQIKEPLSPPQRLIRRNSYTLESPSSVLLEHMAKENAINKKENEKWTSHTEKKEKEKGLEFKPFLSVRKPRRTWNKRCTNQTQIFKDCSQISKHSSVHIKRSRTFVKSNSKSKKTNNSLPCSSRTSPTHLSVHAHSAECIQFVAQKSSNCDRSDLEMNFNLIPEPIKKIKTRPSTKTCEINSTENINISVNNLDLVSTVQNNSNASLLNNTSGSLHSNCGFTDALFPQSIEPSDSASQVSAITQSSISHQKQIVNENVTNSQVQCKTDQSRDIDDSVSICSSLSLSKFMQLDSVSGPPTAEELSTLFSELQLQHERQITELLEKQHKEKVMLTKLQSNSGTLSSRSTSHLSVFDLPYESNSHRPSGSEEKRSSCSRELFPIQILSSSNEVHPRTQKCSTEKAAALKITACVRGYLTRRLLKTEKVQQLIDVIRESLNCAFSLQSETQIRKNDLELHERLAHQLSAALYELQTIINAPAATRMAIIAADRERLKKPVSRPSSAISNATRKSILRRHQSMIGAETKTQENRLRTKSLCLVAKPNVIRTGSFVKSDSSNVVATSSSRKPWR